MNHLEIIKAELERMNKQAKWLQNQTHVLTKALSVAVERIERFQTPCTRTDYTVGQLDKVVCEMADEALKSIAEILNNNQKQGE